MVATSVAGTLGGRLMLGLGLRCVDSRGGWAGMAVAWECALWWLDGAWRTVSVSRRVLVRHGTTGSRGKWWIVTQYWVQRWYSVVLQLARPKKLVVCGQLDVTTRGKIRGVMGTRKLSAMSRHLSWNPRTPALPPTS